MSLQLAKRQDAVVWGPVVSVVVLALANLIAYAANENSWVFKHCLRPLCIPPLLFISNRAECVGRRVRPTTYWAFDLLSPAHLVHSNCLSTHMLLVLHGCTFLYWVITVVVDVAIDYYHVWCDQPSCGRRYGAYGDWASYLTNWSISILGIAGLVALANTARHMHRQRQQQQRGKQRGVIAGAPAAAAAAEAGAGGAAAASSNSNKNRSSSQAQDRSIPRDSSSSCSCPHDGQQKQLQALSPAAGQLQLSSISQQHQQPTVGAATAAAASLQPAVASITSGHPAPALPVSCTTNSNLSTSPHGTGRDEAADAEPVAAEPGCCLAPRSRQGKGATAGAVGSRSAGAGAHAGSSPPAADTVVLVRDAGSSEGAGSSSSSGQALGLGQPECRHELKHKWDFLSCAHCIVMEVATTAAFFVSFWYWVGIVGIASSGFAISAGTLLAHTGNVAVAFLQVVLTRLPIVSYHFQVLLWYATLYSAFLWIFGGATDVWRYGLDWQQSKPAGVFIIIPVVTFIMFTLWYFAAVVREGVLCAEGKLVAKHKRQRRQQHNNSMQHAAEPLNNVV